MRVSACACPCDNASSLESSSQAISHRLCARQSLPVVCNHGCAVLPGTSLPTQASLTHLHDGHSLPCPWALILPLAGDPGLQPRQLGAERAHLQTRGTTRRAALVEDAHAYAVWGASVMPTGTISVMNVASHSMHAPQLERCV